VPTNESTDSECDSNSQSGATEPWWCHENNRKVPTPAMGVTNVEAGVAGATSEGERPDPMSKGARIDPPPIP
jgi:hypothetical protein